MQLGLLQNLLVIFSYEDIIFIFTTLKAEYEHYARDWLVQTQKFFFIESLKVSIGTLET
jgi:hypothetical protein